MPTEIIVRNCAPTLAGLKAGNLFSYRYVDEADLLDTVAEQNHALNPKGVYLVVVKMANGAALVYVYRKRQLERILSSLEVQAFLTQFGYRSFDIGSCLTVLRSRLLNDDFPHDIGVFLGYPLDDIKAFIRNKGANCPCTGCWKAYTNVPEAERQFALFKRCTQIYCQQYTGTTDITRLTVAG